MKTAGVAELKAKLSAHLALVKRGEEVLVTERGRPIARIVPVEPAETDDEARVQRLAAKGLIRMGRKRGPKRPLPAPIYGIPEGALVEAVREDRDESG
jgi:prevent-host-death family protein